MEVDREVEELGWDEEESSSFNKVVAELLNCWWEGGYRQRRVER